MGVSICSWLYTNEVSIRSCAYDACDHSGADTIDKCVNTPLDVMPDQCTVGRH